MSRRAMAGAVAVTLACTGAAVGVHTWDHTTSARAVARVAQELTAQELETVLGSLQARHLPIADAAAAVAAVTEAATTASLSVSEFATTRVASTPVGELVVTATLSADADVPEMLRRLGALAATLDTRQVTIESVTDRSARVSITFTTWRLP